MNKGRVLVGIQFIALGVLLFIPGRKVTQTWNLIGTLIELLGAIILILGFSHLKDSLKVTPEPKVNAELKTNGIYKYIRHPIYAGLILFGLGEVLSKATWLITGAFLVLLIDLTIKYRFEDQLLRATYPQASEYQKKVGALFPKIF